MFVYGTCFELVDQRHVGNHVFLGNVDGFTKQHLSTTVIVLDLPGLADETMMCLALFYDCSICAGAKRFAGLCRPSFAIDGTW